jgi:hypothetical protein
MKKYILKVIGTLTLLTLLFLNVQFIYSVDNNGEKVHLRLVQSEALAESGWVLVLYSKGCRCEPWDYEECDVSAQCLCSWGNCECCEHIPE